VRRRTRALDLVLHGTKRETMTALPGLHERVLKDFLRRNEETYFL
jgi:hypothetical protein